MGAFDNLMKRKGTEPSMVPLPTQALQDINNSLPGFDNTNQPMMDPLSMTSHQIAPYKDNIDMVGLANITIDNKEVVEEFRNKLRGYRIKKSLDFNTGKEKIAKEFFGEPFCSEDGINELCGDLAMFLSKVYILSNVPKAEEKMIKKMCLDIAYDTLVKVGMNVNRWKIDKTKRSTIMNIFAMTIWSNIMRGYDEGERIKLYRSQHTNINTNIQQGMPQQQEKKSLFGF